MTFLDDARDRGVLRQYGAVHEFRHHHVQRHLAPHHLAADAESGGRPRVERNPVNRFSP
ncbi:hypothetical protein [Saccharothrix sp.]|uniref:hypothetical protein n=1 Tax=Saccharothrix sp. TaxID=1873460 RepID=UPI002810B98D|nr:hypothetical protein [Saccharothrix sp.]